MELSGGSFDPWNYKGPFTARVLVQVFFELINTERLCKNFVGALLPEMLDILRHHIACYSKDESLESQFLSNLFRGTGFVE